MVSFLSYQCLGRCLRNLVFLATPLQSVGRQNTFNLLLTLRP